MNTEERDELLALAWGVIANVGGDGGGWEAQTPMWQEAAARWRDKWLAHISKNAKPELPVELERSSLDWRIHEDEQMINAYEAPIYANMMDLDRVEIYSDIDGWWSVTFFQTHSSTDHSGHPLIKDDETFLCLFKGLTCLAEAVEVVEDFLNKGLGQQPVTTTEHSPSEQGQDADSPVQLICDHQKFTICLCGWYDCFNKRDFIYCPKCGEKL